MFVAVYRTSILGLGANEEEAINHALVILRELSYEESVHVCNNLEVKPITEQACDQIIYKESRALNLRNGAIVVM
ncbi:hypothetical protein PsW64_05016 [Pseudovibrio sp. W64]|uniref:hypothetical protein n=1 Tax=Pseudovibrio TaxID=258255 RepID=UPI0007AE50B9|nr:MULTISPECIES: hypothetical protein [unclassified Pseudovibrio]KZK76292.1 hypothetical protein PsW64_05016 [Pseudovibrio sp. W64]KZK82135.1 hypothetical protein PsAD13_03689 [Pseudovibrio sp. Ad13]